MGNGCKMGVDALEITQHVQMHRTGLNAVNPAVAQALEMAFRRLFFQPPHIFLHFHQPTGKIGVASGENGLCHADIIERDGKKALKFTFPIIGKAEAEIDLLGNLPEGCIFR